MKKLILLSALIGLSQIACSNKFKSASSTPSTTETSTGESASPSPQPSPAPAPSAGPTPMPMPVPAPAPGPVAGPAPAPMPMPLPAPSSTPGCGLAGAAFCDNFDQGPVAVVGRAGDLDPTKWSAARFHPEMTVNFAATPVRAAPISKNSAMYPGNLFVAQLPTSCRSSLGKTEVFPPFDTLVCDPLPGGNRRLMTATSVQNYGNNSYMIQQPFDFTGRTGKIVFDMGVQDNANNNTWAGIEITEDPVQAPTWQTQGNFETGPLARNGIFIEWTDNCQVANNTRVGVGLAMVYNNYVRTNANPTFKAPQTGECPSVKPGSLNRYEIRLSQSKVEVYASDFSPDGVNYPGFRLIYSANINLPFSRGYVHLAARNHATIKYTTVQNRPDLLVHIGLFHWDNVGFDGPVINNDRFYSVPDNTKLSQFYGVEVMNLGYMLRDSTGGFTPGMYNPFDRILQPLQVTGVDKTGATKARISLNAAFSPLQDYAMAVPGIRYRVNNGTWHTRTLTAREVQVIKNEANVGTDGSAGTTSLIMDVPLSEVLNGTNTLEFLPDNAQMSFPPVLNNIDLILSK